MKKCRKGKKGVCAVLTASMNRNAFKRMRQEGHNRVKPRQQARQQPEALQRAVSPLAYPAHRIWILRLQLQVPVCRRYQHV